MNNTLVAAIDYMTSALYILNNIAAKSSGGLPKDIDNARQHLCTALSIAVGSVVVGNIHRIDETKAIMENYDSFQTIQDDLDLLNRMLKQEG